MRLVSHANGRCGNIGCKRCFPEYNTKPVYKQPSKYGAWTPPKHQFMLAT